MQETVNLLVTFQEIASNARRKSINRIADKSRFEKQLSKPKVCTFANEVINEQRGMTKIRWLYSPIGGAIQPAK